MRLIDADALIAYCDEKWIPLNIDAVNEQPTIEPKIIRCKDCKHNGGRPIGGERYWCKLHDSYMQFCSDAKKRTGQ